MTLQSKTKVKYSKNVSYCSNLKLLFQFLMEGVHINHSDYL